MWRLILFFLTRPLILHWFFKFLYLGSKMIQIIIFILNTLRGCSRRIQICSMRIQNTPRGTSAHESFVPVPSLAHFLLLPQHHGGAKYCSMRIQNVSGVAQCGFKIWRELLYFII
jgi:hypothetical protein